MKPKRGVVLRLLQVTGQVSAGRRGCRWRPSGPSGTTLASHSAVLSMMEWNQTKGSWRRRVLVGRRRHFGRVGGADSRVAAVGAPARVRCAAVTRRRVPHVLLVGAPGRDVGGLVRRILGVELVGDRLHRGRVDAALTVHLARVQRLVGVGRPRLDVGEGEAVVGAVGLGVLGRGLAPRPGRCSCRGCRARRRSSSAATRRSWRRRGVQVVGGGRRAEGQVVALVLQLDEEDGVDLPGRQGGPDHLGRRLLGRACRRRPPSRRSRAQQRPRPGRAGARSGRVG